MAAPVDEVIERARDLLARVLFDERGTMIGGKHVGGNGGLLSRETIMAAEQLHRALDTYDTARSTG